MVVYKNTDASVIDKYIKKLKNQGYEKMVIQKYIPSFGTPKNQELKTYWVKDKYMYSIKVIGSGMGYGQQKIVKRIPSYIKKQCVKLINALECKFKTSMILTRIDWGRTEKGMYFINEIEYAPGTYAELFNENEWKLNAQIGNHIIENL